MRASRPNSNCSSDDTVVVWDPDVVAERHGAGALYVSLTRATQRFVLASAAGTAG